MASLSDAEECLKEEEEVAKKPAKKKKKKKKKSAATELESEVSPTEESASSGNFDEKTPIDYSIIAKEKTDIYPETLVEETPSKSEETSKFGVKDEAKPRGSCEDVTNTKQPGSASTESKSKKKKKSNKETTSAVENVAEEKEKRPEIIQEEVKDKENDVNRGLKRSDSAEVDGSFEVVRTKHPKPSDEDKSSSPATKRKKKKKKKKSGFLLSDALTEPQNDSDKEKNGAKASMEEQTTSSSTDLEEFTKETSLLWLETREKNNWSRICILTYGLGLDTLRKLFLDIHPSWTNKCDDAKNLDKGKMKLKSHEQALFNAGDINKWDVSLITTVLLYSKKCANELKLRPGYEDAIRTIKEQKNWKMSHKSSERMHDDEFNTVWDKICKSIETLGASKKDIDELFKDDVLEDAKYYRDMHLQELASRSAIHTDVKLIHSKVDDIQEEVQRISSHLFNPAQSNTADQNPLQNVSQQKWDEWLRFRDNVKSFDFQKNNYILITDAMSAESLKHFSVLRNVPWKIVLDFNPASEEKGMYHRFNKKTGKNSLIDMTTPDEIQRKHPSTSNLARHIDSRKTQWLFVREREKDNLANGGARPFEEWKSQCVKHLYRFLTCCSEEKMDKHKPLICVVLPFREESRPFVKVALKKLSENFSDFSLRFVGIKHDNIGELHAKFNMHLTDLGSDLLHKGLESLLHCSHGKEYRMPTCQAEMPANLTENELLSLQEYLDVLYDGCEDIPPKEEEEKFEKFLNEHRESFLSGNWISFVSLKYEHDARRELGNKVRNHIQQLLVQGPTHSTIVEIRHCPGTGGSTIARRVLWELHEQYPCAIAKLDYYKHYDIDDECFINPLAERIGEVQEICQMNPLILLDGKHALIEALSNKLVRALNRMGRRAVLLTCLHRSSKADKEVNPKAVDVQSNPDASDVHARFNVNVNLEDSSADLKQFQDKYREYIDKFQKTKTETLSPSRVFHFPLLAMLKGLKGFGTKLKQIIHESFDGLEGLQKEIAVVVAFIKHYAAQSTPGCLLYKAFKKYVRKGDQEKGITYEDINQLITEQLLNLMVPARPRRNHRQATQSSAPEGYSLQHPLVADMVLQRYFASQNSDIAKLTYQFLDFPIFEDDRFFSLVNDLFIRNRSSLSKSRLSFLLEDLKSQDPKIGAQVFCSLADKTGNAIMFAHAAKYHSKMNPPRFSDALDLMSKAFECKNAQAKSRIIHDMQGGILHSKLKWMSEKYKIDSLEMLEDLADKALQSYKRARTWPPAFASPLIGEVKVWIACIEWIIKHECNGDADKGLDFITSKAPPFFRTCIGDSFCLLDIVDGIVLREQNLPEPDETQKLANTLKLSMLSIFNKGRLPGRKGKDRDIIRECAFLTSDKNFSKCSQTELQRLQVHYILASVDQLETLQEEHLKFLLKLLEDLVLASPQSSGYMACHLMKVCLLITGSKQYSLEKGLQITDRWINESSYDPMPYFYKMMIYFIQVLEGNQVMYRDSYNKALKKCKANSENHCRAALTTHFLKKTGEGMNRLMTRNALLTGEQEYPKNLKGFWTIHSRKKLLECCGRIQIRPGRRRQVFIELIQGNIELYVGKTADIGKFGPDYSNGTMVYFVVSFNLQGPVANGITFKPKDSSTK